VAIMSVAPVPDWLFPPEGGFEATDLDRLPDLPPHAELIDGSLVLVSPQDHFHSLALDVLVATLRSTAPAGLRVRREITVVLNDRQRPEPDISVFDSKAMLTKTSIDGRGVRLIIEVVSPESRERDRERKPQLYAEAEIQHFWLVEQEKGAPVLHTYELDTLTGSYVPTGIHHGTAKFDVPYPIEIDLSEIDRL
jgi:Uma2 family endonuclease